MIDDDDHARAVWLNAGLISVTVLRNPVPVVFAAGHAAPLATFRAFTHTPHDDACPTHGPPGRGSSLRGPPSFPA